MKFAVYANGTYWGIFVATDAETALKIAAEELGTDGNTDGMTAELISEHFTLAVPAI